ncbi:MAG: DeoR family transcriptional regulator [Candidatus Liptonbacteria bacterium]|nr:DeoR family transcriptional regulator [Candidatus Liptonbacteria bacterium]
MEKKAYEIGYAITRICAAIRNAELARQMSAYAVRLVESASVFGSPEEESGKFRRTATVLLNLVSFGEGIGEISYRNADVLVEQLRALEQYAATLEAQREDVRIDHLFERPITTPAPATEGEVNRQSAIESAIGNGESASQSAIGNGFGKLTVNDESAINRQSAIADIIGKTQHCRMKDLVSAFPDTSERTLRNDVQRLVEKGTIQRVGATHGPGGSYARV